MWLTGRMRDDDNRSEFENGPPNADDALAARLAALSARQPTGPEPRRAAGDAPSDQVAARAKRRHPAQGARVAALGLSLASTGGLAALFALTTPQAGTQVQAASIVADTNVGAPSVQQAATSTSPAASSTTVTSDVSTTDVSTTDPTTESSSATVIDGGVFHNRYGDVQVRATIAADGSLIDVTALETPYQDNKSVRINERAVPQLNAEALTAQSANVDTVSGATYTSNDYRRSLQSAIDAAVAAGITVVA